MLKLLSPSSKGAIVAIGLLGMAPCARAAPQGMEKLQHVVNETKQPDAIATAVAELAHPDAGVRERASRYLWLAGKAATGALTAAAESGDPEVATRARSILLDFKFGIYPDTPKEVRDIIVSYRDGQAKDKVAALQALWGMGRPAYPVLARLWLAETDERLSSDLYRQIAQHGPAMASALIAEEEHEAAEMLLEMGVKDGADASIRGLAAYRLLRGELDPLAKRLRERIESLDDKQVQLLAHLYRAKGDLQSARALLAKIPATMKEQLLVETGNWRELAQLGAIASGDGASIEQIGLLAAYRRLAGEAQAADAMLKLLSDAGAGGGAGPAQRTSAVALLMNDRPGEAVEVLRKGGHAVAALQVLAAQQRYRAALELAEKAEPNPGAEALRLSAMKGAVLHHVGEEREAGKIFETLAGGRDQAGSVASLAAGLEVALRWDLDEQAVLFTSKLLAPSRPNPDPAEILNQVFYRRGAEAGYWWSFFREAHAGEAPEKSLKRVWAIMRKELPETELLALARQARESATKLPRHWRYKRLELLGLTLRSYNLDAEAESVLLELVKETGRTETYLQLGHAATRQRKWEEAAEHYSQAMQRDRSQAVPRYLRGWALVQLGQEQPGRALMEQAVLMPLADEAERYRLAEALRDVGLADAEVRQYELILATGPAHSEIVGRVLWRLLFNDRFVNDDLTRASRLADRAVVGFFGNLDDFDITAYLGVAHLAQKLRARALLADGSIDEAMTVAHACFAMLPASSNLVIEMTPQLEKLGRRERADELVARAVALHETLIADHPKCASHHNSLAWTLARCRRQLDRALAHAKRAAELEPANCAILDTLAEVHFQRGETEQAIRAIGKCIELEPGVERHRLALERFKKLTPDTEPPEE
jgi:tetratricopeptide (TPR) repeat protein